MTGLTPSGHAALMLHDAAFAVGEAVFDGVPVVTTVDRLGSPCVVTVLGRRANGSILHGRRSVPVDADGYPDLQDTVDRAFAVGRPMRLPLSGALEWFGMRERRAGFVDHYAKTFSVRHGDENVPLDILEGAAEAHLLAAGAPDMAETLDAGSLAALACVGTFEATAYDFYAAEGQRGEARRQAAGAYPLLAADMAARPLVKFAVDMRKPLAEHLERAYGADEAGTPFMTKALLRKLQGAKLKDHGIPTEVLVQTLGRMPPEWAPKNESEWDSFCAMTHTGFRDFAREIRERPDKLCPNMGGKWSELRTRVAKAAASTLPPEELDDVAKRAWRPVGDETVEGLASAFANAHDVVKAFRDLVVLPVSVSEVSDDAYLGPETRQLAFDAAARILYGGKSLVAIMETQRQWHVQAPTIMAATETDVEAQRQIREVAEDGWAPLCDVIQAPNGTVIVPLTDPRELKDEGAGGLGVPGPDSNGITGLGHCVGGYSAQCKKGDAHIVSFRRMLPDGSFRRLSTAEFNKLRADSDVLSCRQHQGVRNGPAPPDAKEAYDWFVEEVAARRIPLNRDGIRALLEGKPVVTDEVQQAAGYDRRDLDLVERVLDAWRPFLPKRLKDVDLDGLRECAEMQELVDAIAPRFRAARYA